MGLRVATLVNLSFVGGDRARRSGGRFSATARARAPFPDGIRRFGTWAPLLIPFYIPRGAEWDKAWTGAEALSHGGARCPGAVRRCAVAYALAGVAMALTARSVIAAPRRAKDARPPPPGARRRARRRSAIIAERLSFNNGAVGVELMRDGRGAAFVMGGGARRLRRSTSSAARSIRCSRAAISSTSARTARRRGRSASSRRAAPATIASTIPPITGSPSPTRSAGSTATMEVAPDPRRARS